jgi:hypothetical protein
LAMHTCSSSASLAAQLLGQGNALEVVSLMVGQERHQSVDWL